MTFKVEMKKASQNQKKFLLKKKNYPLMMIIKKMKLIIWKKIKLHKFQNINYVNLPLYKKMKWEINLVKC